MVVGSQARDPAPCDERGLEMQDALEILKRTVVHRDRRGRYPPFAALRGPSRGAVEWGIWCEDVHSLKCNERALLLHKAFDQPILMGEYIDQEIYFGELCFQIPTNPLSKESFPRPRHLELLESQAQSMAVALSARPNAYR